MTDLGTLSGPANNSCAYAINDNGDVVGLDEGSGQAFLYTNQMMIGLGTACPGLYSASCAYGINNNGQVAGYTQGCPGTSEDVASLYSGGTWSLVGVTTAGNSDPWDLWIVIA